MIPFEVGNQKYYFRTKRDSQSSLLHQCTDSRTKSYFDFDKCNAQFHGVLDIETLGGAGFASQRTTGDDRKWDLSGKTAPVMEICGILNLATEFAGIQLDTAKGDSM
jgi:hypothetical protein